MTVSWVILTYNRADIVKRALEHNMENAGAGWDELIWVDNGSETYADPLWDLADTIVLNKTNLGVSKGYNRGLGLATKEYVVITGCDMLMPANWLARMLEYVEKIPGIACVYSTHWTQTRERIRGVPLYAPLPHIEAFPIERRIFKRELLAEIGYFPETFGLYGHDDIAWAHRAERVCAAKGLKCYVIPDMVAKHLGTEGMYLHAGGEDKAYHNMKQREVLNPAKRIELERLASLNWPRFSPFY